MSSEQKIITTTFIKLSLLDGLKCLFGGSLKIMTTCFIPQENIIERYNSSAKCEVVNTTVYFTKQDKPNYGYSPKEKIN